MKFLVLNHHSDYLPELVNYFNEKKIRFDLLEPLDADFSLKYNGIIASGGVLPNNNRKIILEQYKDFLSKTQTPFFGICLGLKILGHCHGARIKKIDFFEGKTQINFFQEFPLLSNTKTLNAFESHGFELIEPLPSTLENFAFSNVSKVEAIRVKNKQQFAVQFHPEKSEEGLIILDNFIDLCNKSTK
ncbi:MAG: gamma-glutamyl-gamma-aminobutyrate hydrolase family protein [archaeon]|nr:gamma-glutamyl-gamma-aminobutyrate hydrolase family protein [archaeon]